VSDPERHVASVFASATKWKDPFNAIADDSETLVAGMAGWVRVTTYQRESKLVYFLVTRAGLHVGQQASKGAFSRSYVDHFLPREDIRAVETDYQHVFQADGVDGARVIIWFDDAFSQFSNHFMSHAPAFGQARTVANALGHPFEAR
jgi:hypothetical protein